MARRVARDRSGRTAHLIVLRHVVSGSGRPVVLLHGNPTSSYLWRHVLPALPGRLIALDLVGMGGSEKPPIGYRLADHISYVSAFLDALDLSDLVLVGHDWGVAIALSCVRDRPDRVAGVAFMEGHLRPLSGWDRIDPVFRDLRAPGTGERMVLGENFFIETLLPAACPSLTPADLDVYRRPFPTPESRRPILQWAREIPIAGSPADNVRILDAAWDHLCGSAVPKLLVHGDPGAIVTADVVAMCRDSLSHLTVADVGPGGHFLPEDAPVGVAAALAGWLSGF
jgi:haloalkane dehalogenase